MAERRMFAKTIIDSDAFLDMPQSTQCLYFHLSMRADDEGFINNPKRIMRTIGASDDDLKLLVAKSFLIPFESGVVVIKHWRIHNYIQKDRFKSTVYEEERAQLTVKKNGAYTRELSTFSTQSTKSCEIVDTRCIQDGYTMDTKKPNMYPDRIQDASNTYPTSTQPVHKTETQVRLGKVSIDESSLGKERKEEDISNVNNIQDLSTKSTSQAPVQNPSSLSIPSLEEMKQYVYSKKHQYIKESNLKTIQTYVETGLSDDWKKSIDDMNEWNKTMFEKRGGK